jgi:excisionase family DNA binding protein
MALSIIRTHVRELVSRKEAADILDVQPQTLAKWASVQRYDLPYIRVGKAVRYRRSDLQKFLERNTVGANLEN